MTLALALFALSPQLAPLKLKTQFFQNLVSTEVQIKLETGLSARMLIDSGSYGTFLTSTFANEHGIQFKDGAVRATMELGGKQFIGQKFEEAKLTLGTEKDGADGIIGRDLLDNYALGLDFLDASLELWPTSPSEQDANKWLLSGAARAGFAQPIVRSMKLDRLPDGQPITSGGRPHLIPDTGSGYTFLLDRYLLPKNKVAFPTPIWGFFGSENSEVRIMERLDPPGLDFVLTAPFFKSYRSFFRLSVPDGILGVSRTLSPRILLDLKGNRLYWLEGSDIETRVWRLGMSTSIFLAHSSGQLKLIVPADEIYKPFTQFDGARVMAIADMTASEIISDLQKYDDASISRLLTNIDRSLRKPHVLVEFEGKILNFVVGG